MINFLRFLVNYLFNREDEPGRVTPPPMVEEDDPRQLPRANLLWRYAITQAIHYSHPNWPDMRPNVPVERRVTAKKLIMRECTADPVWFAAGFCVGVDPRLAEDLQERPFIPWKGQCEIINKMRGAIDSDSPREDVIFHKGRDIGATFIAVIVCLHGWLFRNESFMWVTLTEDKLDSGTQDSVFGKMRYIYYRLPDWMLPVGWTRQRQGSFDKRQHLIKPEWHTDSTVRAGGFFQATGPSIDGYAATGEAGVSSRYKAIFIDEFGAIGDQAKISGTDARIWERSSDSVKCRIGLGTPRGRDTHHSKLYIKARRVEHDEIGPDERRTLPLFLNWEGDPRKSMVKDEDGRWHGALPKFTMSVRPKSYRDMEEFYSTMLRLYYLSRIPGVLDEDELEDCPIHYIAGRQFEDIEKTPDQLQDLNREYKKLLDKCGPLNPQTEKTELSRPWSAWVLSECKDKASTKEGQEHIVTDIFGQEVQTEHYFFNPEILDRQPVEQHRWGGDFENIYQDHRSTYFNPDLNGQVYIWQMPETGHVYGMTSDAGMGQGKDYSVIAVWDVTDWPVRLVAMFRDNTTGPEAMALYVVALHQMYGYRPDEDGLAVFGAYWLPEANAEGRSTISRAMLELKMPRQSVYVRGDHPSDPNDLNPYGRRSAFKEGRESLFVALREQLEDAESIQLCDSIMVGEIESILRDTWQPDDEEMGHDDAAICAAMVPEMVKGFNKALRGNPIFDVLGPLLSARYRQDIGRRERHAIMRRKRTLDVDEDIPIWSKSAA